MYEQVHVEPQMLSKPANFIATRKHGTKGRVSGSVKLQSCSSFSDAAHKLAVMQISCVFYHQLRCVSALCCC